MKEKEWKQIWRHEDIKAIKRRSKRKSRLKQKGLPVTRAALESPLRYPISSSIYDCLESDDKIKFYCQCLSCVNYREAEYYRIYNDHYFLQMSTISLWISDNEDYKRDNDRLSMFYAMRLAQNTDKHNGVFPLRHS